jgi:uncharacterized protein (DUF427 family)
MKATVDGKTIAESADIVERGGYHYFPLASVRRDWLEKAPRSARDLECPHAVQFYDVVVDGQRHARAAWIYEVPQGTMTPTADRVGFWQDVKVG